MTEFFLQLPCSEARMIEVIFVSTYRGSNQPGNPRRQVFQYWSKDGNLLAEYDTLYPSPDAPKIQA